MLVRSFEKQAEAVRMIISLWVFFWLYCFQEPHKRSKVTAFLFTLSEKVVTTSKVKRQFCWVKVFLCKKIWFSGRIDMFNLKVAETRATWWGISGFVKFEWNFSTNKIRKWLRSYLSSVYFITGFLSNNSLSWEWWPGHEDSW